VGIIILDGVVEEIGFGSYSEGERTLSFIKVNGRRIKKVVCDDFMRSFLKVGRTVKLSLVPGILGTHTLYAAKLEDGEVVMLSSVKPVSMVIALGVGIIVLLSPFFIGVLKATHSIGFSMIIFGLIGISSAYLILRNHFKARLIFGKP
jgi:hypothetical protein